MNQGGSVLHTGTGIFDTATVNLIRAGGSLVTRGGLTLTADDWTNSSVIQVGRLTVNVKNLTQTGSGQLLATDSFTGTGVNWSNDGLIASDGAASLTLSGNYSGNGRYTSLSTLGLSAAQVSLGNTASIAGGGNTTINVGGQLNNYGRITSAGGLSVNAGSINNYGTLGSNGNLLLSAPTLLNQGGLIFSGGDMALQVNSFTNHSAQLYSFGAVSIDGYGGAAQATEVINISGAMESTGKFSINAANFENRTESFSMGRTLVSGAIAYNCTKCWGHDYIFSTVVREVYEGQDNDTSASASLSAGSDFVFRGGNFLNSKSTISAGGNISIQADNLKNVGAVGGTIERTRSYQEIELWRGFTVPFFGEVIAYNQRNNPDFPNIYYINGSGGLSIAIPENYRHREGGRDGDTIEEVRFKDSVTGQVVTGVDFSYAYQQIPTSQYDRNNLAPLPDRLQSLVLLSDVEVAKDGAGSGRSAVIQAAGNVSISATQDLNNSVIHQDYGFSAGANKVQGTQVAGTGAPVAVRLNAQLPPDLAQQQVNPLALPGFSLPTGQNGLFRLSGQSGSAQQGAVVPGWSVVGTSIGIAQRLAGTTDVQARSVPLSSADGAVAASGGQSLARVQGLPDTSGKTSPQKYLIETNPVLTDLKQFMSSDYLLAGLGYKPDESAKRLGDGFYEQKLIQQAVVARTGQRFIDGQTSDEKLFKYLMDNAISSKQQLNLSVGVSLTAQQVAALTHDIVWMETQVVNGEEVLVPVLYLAQATNRLAPNGALIQGADVTLIAGANLENSGTLRASDNLSAVAGKDLLNTGLVEASNRLDALASNNIVNKSGGIIAGRDVSLTATHGDVVNQRDITRIDSNYGGTAQHRDYLDSVARIEAANNLSVSAGRDISNGASVLSSGADMKLSAGRDLNVNAIAERTTDARGGSYLSQQITQHGAVVTAGRDLQVSAGRDISAIASAIESKRDMALASDGDIRIESAANENQFASRGRSTLETRSVSQQSSELKAGGNISVDSGKDLDIIASRIKAGGDIALNAVQDMTIASAKNESSYYYYKKSSGSFGRSSSKQVESYDSTNVASVIDAGHDLTVNSTKAADGSVGINGGRDLSIVGSKLKAGDDLILAATNNVAVLSGVEEHGSYSKKTSSGFLGLSKSGKSQLKTAASQVGSELDAGNDVVVASGNDIRLRASQMAAGNDVELRAGLVTKTGDINLVSANDTAYSKTEEYKKKAGLSVSGGFISFSSAKEAGREAQSSTSVGSHVIADRDATLQAERDINVSGSGVKAGRNVTLDAGRDVNVVAAQNSAAQQDWEKKKQSGIGFSSDDNGINVFVGTDIKKENNRSEQQTAAASQIDAGENLTVNAKRDINQVGSDLRASNDINLTSGRNINIDAARETQLTEQQREAERNGVSATINHNFGKTKDAVNGAGKGEDNVSKGSSTLKAVDAVSQFLAGPTADDKIGNSKQSATQQVIEQTNRSSTMNAGNDLNLHAGNDVTVKGGQLQAGRDINVKGRDVTLDVAKGSASQESSQSESWGGIHGGTSGGFKIGIGGSYGVATSDGVHGSSTGTQVAVGRDVNLDASHDLSLIGTQVKAGRDIALNAGNDLNVRSVQNDSNSGSNRHNGGGEVGLVFGSEGIGVYASVSMGKGDLDREGKRQQEAYLYAGDRLGFHSGKDTNIAGATLRGNEVVGRVGGDLNVSSAVDTGTVKGKEFDISVTATIGPGAGVSGSVGYGQTTGKTNWVEQQTSVTGKDKVDIRTENHTQLDGALIAADNGNLKLDTGTLGFSDIAGADKEHGYYLNVGGSYSKSGGNAQDSSQVGKGKEGETGWSVSGWNYEKDREQVVRATVGSGEIVVRKDSETGGDSSNGLNRDVGKAYDITRDRESLTDLYASNSSIDAISHPVVTTKEWAKSFTEYDQNAKDNFALLGRVVEDQLDKFRSPGPGDGAIAAGGEQIAEEAMSALLEAGYRRKDARELLEDKDFQTQVLQMLKELNSSPGTSAEKVNQVQQDLIEKNIQVTLRVTNAELALDKVSAINKYMTDNPQNREAVELIMAASQGPKGVILLVAQRALGETDLMKGLAQLQGDLQAYTGRLLAEKIEGKDLDPDVNLDAFRLGGGTLMAGVLIGMATASTNKSKGAKEPRTLASPVYKTTKEARQAAEALGFEKINETVHGGQAVFKNGKDYITRDLDGHNGGAWKMADSVKALGSKETRAGTFDVNLNRIGD
nr:hemagglutinin repeat-containing protein [Pseudomonas sp. MWU12-2345]